jgi:hypothetical protein
MISLEHKDYYPVNRYILIMIEKTGSWLFRN